MQILRTKYSFLKKTKMNFCGETLIRRSRNQMVRPKKFFISFHTQGFCGTLEIQKNIFHAKI